jgi:hypothetical protein
MSDDGMAIDEGLFISYNSSFFNPINAALSCNILTASIQPVEISVRRAVVSNLEVGGDLPSTKRHNTDVDSFVPFSLAFPFRLIVLVAAGESKDVEETYDRLDTKDVSESQRAARCEFHGIRFFCK